MYSDEYGTDILKATRKLRVSVRPILISADGAWPSRLGRQRGYLLASIRGCFANREFGMPCLKGRLDVMALAVCYLQTLYTGSP